MITTNRPVCLAIFVLTFSVNFCALACNTCGLSSSLQLPGVATATRAFGLSVDSFTASLGHSTSFFRVTRDNNLRTTESDLELVRSFSSTQLATSYNFSSSLGLQVTLPIVTRSYERFVRFQKQRETETGLGDMTTLLTYSPYSWTDCDDRAFVMLFGGLKLPTGDSGSLSRIVDNSGDNPSQVLQGRGLSLGTGSIDLPIGFTAYGRSGHYFALAVSQFTFRTEGTADYKFANDLSLSLTQGYVADNVAEGSLSFGVTLSGESKGNDSLAGQSLSRTSVNNLYIGPELIFIGNKKLTIQVGADFPVITDVGGAAVEPELRLRGMLNWVFG